MREAHADVTRRLVRVGARPKATRIMVITAQTSQMEQAYRKRRSKTRHLKCRLTHTEVGVHASLLASSSLSASSTLRSLTSELVALVAHCQIQNWPQSYRKRRWDFSGHVFEWRGSDTCVASRVGATFVPDQHNTWSAWCYLLLHSQLSVIQFADTASKLLWLMCYSSRPAKCSESGAVHLAVIGRERQDMREKRVGTRTFQLCPIYTLDKLIPSETSAQRCFGRRSSRLVTTACASLIQCF